MTLEFLQARHKIRNAVKKQKIMETGRLRGTGRMVQNVDVLANPEKWISGCFLLQELSTKFKVSKNIPIPSLKVVALGEPQS